MPIPPEDNKANEFIAGLCAVGLTDPKLDPDEPIMDRKMGNSDSGYQVYALAKDPTISKNVPPGQRRCALAGDIPPEGTVTVCTLCDRRLVIKPYMNNRSK